MNKPRPALNVSLDWLFSSSACYSATLTVRLKLFAKSYLLAIQRPTHSVKIGPSGPWISVGAFDYSVRADEKFETNLFGFGFDDPSTSIGQCKLAGISLKVKPSAPLSKPFIGLHNIALTEI